MRPCSSEGRSKKEETPLPGAGLSLKKGTARDIQREYSKKGEKKRNRFARGAVKERKTGEGGGTGAQTPGFRVFGGKGEQPGKKTVLGNMAKRGEKAS